MIRSSFFVAAGLLAASCAADRPNGPSIAAGERSDVVFTDVTASAGLRFVHHNGRSGLKYLPETLGPGVAVLDFDNDGAPDLYFANSGPFNAADTAYSGRLYANNGDGTFRDVTRDSGLETPFYGMGVAVGDYDNDGFTDLYVTALGPDKLFRNRGDGVFEEVSARAGIDNPAFGTSAAFLDYDRDGALDLFVCNYVEWSPETDLWCALDGVTKSYCTPESYPGVASKLYRNNGDGTFSDASVAAGVSDSTSKALGVAVLDYDGDGWPDVFQANDTEPNKLYRNNGDGTFTDVGLSADVAFGEDGRARGAMGVDAADYDASGREHLLVGNFSNEMVNLFRNQGGGLFVDEAPASELGRKTFLTLAFGAFFFDYDLDGAIDIFLANGHLDAEIENVQPKVAFAQPPQLFRNMGGGRFAEASGDVGPGFARPLVARGAAYLDYDRDGDLDLVVTTNDGPAYLYRNDGGNANSRLAIDLIGSASNRSALGARVTIEGPAGRQSRTRRGGSSYLSQSELTTTFGLGIQNRVDAIEVAWPSGAVQRFENVEANRRITIREDEGLSSAR